VSWDRKKGGPATGYFYESRRVPGKLPEADFAFLDEVYKASSAILNVMLKLLNERAFRRGAATGRRPSPVRCRLRSIPLPGGEFSRAARLHLRLS
jgi:MoxR-like ATPase